MQALPITPFGDLKQGDRFIRVGGRPVQIREIAGSVDWIGETVYFYVEGMPASFPVFWMVQQHGGFLREEYMPGQLGNPENDIGEMWAGWKKV